MKIIAIIGLFLFLRWAMPHFAEARWVAPAAISPDWWGYQNPQYYNPRIVARPTADATWGRFDVWNQL